MGESACLLRSFSHPSDASREVREGDPIRALTESVSFGRFMSESLAWEKWSAFSHNRYLEEVEKFAKPGSVAQKKAYFEAHYRRKAALRDASRIEEPSLGADIENAAAELEPTEAENRIKCDQQQEEDSSDNSVDISVGSAEVPLEQSKSEDVEATRSGSLEQGPATETLARDENSTQMCHLDECIERRISDTKQEGTDPRTSSSSGRKTRGMSSSKSLNQSQASKLLLPCAKRIAPTEQKGKDSVPIRVKSVVEKKKSASKSLHMSISFATSNVSTNKTLSPVLQQIRKLKDSTASLKFQQDSSIPQKIPTRASVNAKSKVASTTPESEEKRTKTVPNKSVAGRLVTDKSLTFLSKANSKYPITNGSKGQSPIVCSPFRFRSEERAAKRREKQEEKVKASEAEKVKPRERYWLPSAKKRPSSQTPANEETANHGKGKSNSCERASVLLSRSRNNVRENSSPNIQR